MKKSRRTWQHIFEDRSESQLNDAFQSVGWVVERLKKDYGEDLFVRPFENGNPVGHEFFVQLKGTDNIEQYFVDNGKYFSYPIELVNLEQWYTFTLPIILILWDINKRIGYWVHVQPFIKQKLAENLNWLDNISKAKEPKRKIYIPSTNLIKEQNLDALKSTIKTEWRKIEQGKNHFEILYRTVGDASDQANGPELPSAIKRQLRLIELKAMVIAEPRISKLWSELAALYYESNDIDEALKAITQAWDLDTFDKKTRQTRACILAEYAIKNSKPSSMLHEAITLFQSESKTTNAAADYNLGNCYSALGEHKKAIAYYKKALSKHPEHKLAARIWTNRGNAANDAGSKSDAIHSFEKALKLNPTLWNAHASRATLEMQSENFEDACKYFRNAIQCNPELESSGDNLLYSYAYVLYKIGHHGEALRVINQLLSVHPAHTKGLNIKAHILHELRKIDKTFANEALTFFKERLIDDPNDMSIRSELNSIYLAQGYLDERRKLLAETVALDNPPSGALYDYAMILKDDGNYDEATTLLERVPESKRDHRVVHTLARLKAQRGYYHDALMFYNLALADVSDPLPILGEILECQHFLKDYQSCIVTISKALMVNPKRSSSWWNNLRYALNQLGIDSTKYTNFLISKMHSGNDLSEDEIRSMLTSIIKPAA
jgi:tetratricopeptide (TPR) repeat protein